MLVNLKICFSHIIAILFLLPINAFAHGGGLDANGGHMDRKLGVYHCHRDYCQPTAKTTVNVKNRHEEEARPKMHMWLGITSFWILCLIQS